MATLFDFYRNQGQSLPSIAERAKLYESSGLGSAAIYRGTSDQNTALLAKLGGGASPAPAPTMQAPVTTAAVSAPAGMSDYISQAKEMYGQVYQPYEQLLREQLASQQQVYGQQKQALEAQQPLIQQRYDALLKELAAKDAETQAEIKKQGEAAIGETRARAGARGTFSSGIEQGQEAKIGENVAGIIKSQAEGTQRTKFQYDVAKGEEENKIKGMIADLASRESEQGFKVRQAIATIGPETLDKAISLAATMRTDQRAQEELQLSKDKFAFERGQASKGTKSEQALNSLRIDAQSGATVNQLVSKYAGVVDGKTIADIYDAINYYGKPMSPTERDRLYGESGTSATTTADAISKVFEGVSDRKSAETNLSIYGPTWANLGVDVNAVRQAIDAKFPPKKSSRGKSYTPISPTAFRGNPNNPLSLYEYTR